jgi:hypothetical protein
VVWHDDDDDRENEMPSFVVSRAHNVAGYAEGMLTRLDSTETREATEETIVSRTAQSWYLGSQ